MMFVIDLLTPNLTVLDGRGTEGVQSHRTRQNYRRNFRGDNVLLIFSSVHTECEIAVGLTTDYINTDCQRQWAKCNRKPVAPPGVKV